MSAIGDLTDGQLLERFIATREEAAFETLIERYGSLVWGVCRRVLDNHHDAEDAFQATFLVLAVKAAAIVPREKLPNWLYGVACQTALRVRSATAKRHRREKPVAVLPEREAEAARPLDERHGLLDQELRRLPDKYRAPIVLCALESLTHQEAAARLGCPIGTLSARLSRGRALLAKRLHRRGVAVSVGGLALLLARDSVASAVPPSLAASTLKGAILFARGRAFVSGFASVEAVKLAQGAITTMGLTKLKSMMAIVASLAAVGTATALLAHPPAPGGRAEPGEVAITTDPTQPIADRPLAKPAAQPAVDRTVALQATAEEPTTPPAPAVQGTRIWNAALSPDGKRIAAGVEGTPGQPAELIVWDLESRRELLRFTEPRASRSVAFSPDGKSIATGGFGSIARIFDAKTGRPRRPLRGHTAGINAVAFAPDGKSIATGSWDKTVKLWNVAGGGARATLTGHTAQVFGLAYGPDGKTVASCGVDGTARIWDTETGAQKAVLNGHEGTVECLAYSPDGKTLATAGWDHTVRLWDAATGRPLATLEGPSDQIGIGFSPDGKILATLSAPEQDAPPDRLTSMLTLWDMAERKEIASIPAHAARSYSILFTPDGKTLITSSLDRTIKVWDIASRQTKATFTSAPVEGAEPKPPRSGPAPTQ